MSTDEVEELTSEERLMQAHKRERKELQGSDTEWKILSYQEFEKRYNKTISISFNLNEVCSTAVTQYLRTHAISLGCSEKCLLFPLLSCCAACMGSEAIIEVTSEWKESPVLWTLVISPVTLKRVNIIEVLKHQLLEVWNELNNVSSSDTSEKMIPQFMFEFFDIDGLYELLKQNKGHGFGMYTNIEILQKQVTSSIEKEILLKLNNALPWILNKKSISGIIKNTCVNVTAFSEPDKLFTLISRDNEFAQFLQNCFIIICSEEKQFSFKHLLLGSCKDFKKLFKDIFTLHKNSKITYKFTLEALNTFYRVQKELMETIRMHQWNIRKLQFFSSSLLIRLACILHVLDNIVEAVIWNQSVDIFTWNNEISVEAILHAKYLLCFILLNHAMITEPYTRNMVFIKNIIQSMSEERRDISSTISNAHKNANYSRTDANGVQNVSAVPCASSITHDKLTTNINEPFVVTPGIPLSTLRNDSSLSDIHKNVTSISNSSVLQSLLISKTSNEKDASISKPSNSQIGLSSEKIADVLKKYTYSSDIKEFIKEYQNEIKDFLICPERDLTLQLVTQKKFFHDPQSSGEDLNKGYTISFTRNCLSKLEQMGFGTYTNLGERIRRYTFVKTPYSQLKAECKKFLSDFNINEKDYDTCFESDSATTSQNITNDSAIHSTDQKKETTEDVVILD
ncbi:uncharacterized protein LOC111635964 [Centruroides sculpturatus]|uniref:uncharacterized protein LOC111635964 n=1 Tax=Centruroides sculpturatus TaxID=218467 RepID=UPI000C6D24F9|nr:uncharacterized protein LOC111635964 [Centruroides sculpturatus]